MPRKKRKKIKEKDITGLKYFDQLQPLLERLHDVGCERDRAGNRQLHYDEYCMLVLLFLFNPIVTSLRAIQQASELKDERLASPGRNRIGPLGSSLPTRVGGRRVLIGTTINGNPSPSAASDSAWWPMRRA